MVDSVKSAISRIETAKTQKAGSQASARPASAQPAAPAEQDSVQLKSPSVVWKR